MREKTNYFQCENCGYITNNCLLYTNTPLEYIDHDNYFYRCQACEKTSLHYEIIPIMKSEWISFIRYDINDILNFWLEEPLYGSTII
jgi:hypothetical protein